MEAAVDEHRPQLIVCPMLKTMIPESIWAKHRCLVVHPGPRGDRGPSSLDWAIELGAPAWGVTVLEANGEPDAGDVWATRAFRAARGGQEQPVPPRGPARRDRGAGRGDGQDRRRRRRAGAAELGARAVSGQARPLMTQDVRAIDWDTDTTQTVAAQDPRGRRPPGGPGRDRGHASSISSARTPSGRCAGAGRDRRPARRRDLPGDRRRRGVDHAPQAPRHAGGALLQAPGHARARARRRRGSMCPRSRSPSTRRCRRGTPTARSPTRRTRRRRLPALRLLQRRDEHRAVPAAARGLPPRALASPRRRSSR